MRWEGSVPGRHDEDTVVSAVQMWWPHDPAHHVVVELAYRGDDPWAVALTFASVTGPVAWLVARDVLWHGMVTEAGDGDVRVQPGHTDDGTPTVRLLFSSPDGRLEVEADASKVLAFLGETVRRVPIGHEPQHLRMDALIDHLLNRGML